MRLDATYDGPHCEYRDTSPSYVIESGNYIMNKKHGLWQEWSSLCEETYTVNYNMDQRIDKMSE